jgi:hypothetical protein
VIQNVSGLVRLAQGEVVQLNAFQNSGTTLTVNLPGDRRNFFSMYWVGPP